ncbi:hypothetical protein WJX74_001908 [Apatococcus lobatus]|uniref:Acyltransferase 3 domain-containing protein n=1 Tax=Apatococcus lobatus TaxID=904363 RepID=A0AAW1QBJ2_9CHLO
MVALQPLQGVRVLSCVSVVVFHISLLFASAVSAWGWYDAWDKHPWIAISSAGHAIYSLHFFMMMTGILAAAHLVPKLTAQTGLTGQRFKEVWAYYQRRLKRIVPAYYVTVGLITLIKAWPTGDASSAAARMKMNYTMGHPRWVGASACAGQY